MEEQDPQMKHQCDARVMLKLKSDVTSLTRQ